MQIKIRNSSDNASSCGNARVERICPSCSGPVHPCRCKTMHTPSQCTQVAPDSHNLARNHCNYAFPSRIAHFPDIRGILPQKCTFHHLAHPDSALCLRDKHIQPDTWPMSNCSWLLDFHRWGCSRHSPCGQFLARGYILMRQKWDSFLKSLNANQIPCIWSIQWWHRSAARWRRQKRF